MQNLSYENEFDLHDEHEDRTHTFCKNGFARRLVLTQRQKAIWKWLSQIMGINSAFQPQASYILT